MNDVFNYISTFVDEPAIINLQLTCRTARSGVTHNHNFKIYRVLYIAIRNLLNCEIKNAEHGSSDVIIKVPYLDYLFDLIIKLLQFNRYFWHKLITSKLWLYVDNSHAAEIKKFYYDKYHEKLLRKPKYYYNALYHEQYYAFRKSNFKDNIDQILLKDLIDHVINNETSKLLQNYVNSFDKQTLIAAQNSDIANKIQLVMRGFQYKNYLIHIYETRDLSCEFMIFNSYFCQTQFVTKIAEMSAEYKELLMQILETDLTNLNLFLDILDKFHNN